MSGNGRVQLVGELLADDDLDRIIGGKDTIASGGSGSCWSKRCSRSSGNSGKGKDSKSSGRNNGKDRDRSR
jgi:hypothetical protein